MNRIFFILLAMCCLSSVNAQIITGRVNDEHEHPLPFATVAILRAADSAAIAGDVTDDSGRFTIEVADTNVILRVSTVGYGTQAFSWPFPQKITMKPTTTELGEVVVAAVRKYVKMQENGLTVNMDGNPLSKLPSMTDAIRQMPMIDPSDGTVLGKGTPEIYINKRKVRDETEVSHLSPEKVSSVEIITRPGIRYDSNVRAVIIIHTKKLDEGLAGVFTGTGTLSEVTSGRQLPACRICFIVALAFTAEPLWTTPDINSTVLTRSSSTIMPSIPKLAAHIARVRSRLKQT